MSIVHASCKTCGDVELHPHEIALIIDIRQQSCRYAFECAKCLEITSRPAEGRLREILEPLVAVVRLPIPEMLEERTGPPINHDDVLAFANALWGVRS